LQHITSCAQRFPGHVGVNIIRPPAGSRRYTIVVRFDTLEHLQEWLGSEPRRRLIAQVEPLLERGDRVDIKTGLEFWFTPPSPAQRHPAAYKQFLLTLSAIFPLTLLVPWLLRPLFQTVPVQLADLAVLSADYFSIPEEEIKRLESVLMLVGGKVVYGAGEFARLAPPPLPVMPEWSPVAMYGGYARPAAHAVPAGPRA
jgi:antibiotic biosynthesis monooxygenase (ABM) superfamily enzyme